MRGLFEGVLKPGWQLHYGKQSPVCMYVCMPVWIDGFVFV